MSHSFRVLGPALGPSGSAIRWLFAACALSAACQRTTTAPLRRIEIRPSSVVPARDQDEPEAFRRTMPKAGHDVAWKYPAPSVKSLANGVAVYVLPRATGPVSLSLIVRHGASDLPVQSSGLATLTARMLAEATKWKNHHVLSEAAESLGSTIVGDANRDFISLTLDTLPDDYQRGIELLSETLTAPAFSRDDFVRLRKQQLDEIASERQAPARLAALLGLRAVLGERLGSPVSGSAKTVSKLTLDDVRSWYKRFVYPSAVAICIVGPVDQERVNLAAEKALGRLQGKPQPVEQPSPISAPEATQVYVLDRPGSVQSAIFVAQPFPKRRESGYSARQLLDNVLGGQFTSRINHNLREQHAYTYGAHSTAIATRYFGLMTIATSVRTEVTVPAIQEILKELRALRGPNPQRPIADDELQRAKAGLVQRLGAHLEDSHRLADDYEQLFVHELAPNYLESYLSETRELTSAALVPEAARLIPDRLTITVVGDATLLRTQLENVKWQPLPVPQEWLD